MSKQLGGSMFIHNAIEFDYCIKESLASLCAICDDVVVVDAQSTDGTTDLLNDLTKEHKNLRLFTDEPWERGENFDRLPQLANVAKSHLSTPWHFMLQADEVIHEASFPYIREVVERGVCKSYYTRRWNLWGDLNHCFKLNMPQHRKPCNDTPIRLATIDAMALGDAESLSDQESCSRQFSEMICTFHYGMVRRDANFLDKSLHMQGWFFGPHGQCDHRIVEMKASGKNYFDWERIVEREFLQPIPMPHPKFSKAWAEERQAEKIPVKL